MLAFPYGLFVVNGVLRSPCLWFAHYIVMTSYLHPSLIDALCYDVELVIASSARFPVEHASLSESL